MKIVSYLLYLYLRFVYLTTRWKIVGHEGVRARAKAGQPQIFAFWHGRLALMPEFRPPHNQTHVMISRHNDGEWIATIMRCYRLGLVRGSAKRKGSNKERGGRAALVGAIAMLKAGDNVAITPDGPRGPRQRVSGHVVDIALMGGAVIVPMSYATSHGTLLHSWDRFLLPYPFGRGYYEAGAPIAVPEDADAETLARIKQDVEDALNTLTARADKKVGRKDSPKPA